MRKVANTVSKLLTHSEISVSAQNLKQNQELTVTLSCQFLPHDRAELKSS